MSNADEIARLQQRHDRIVQAAANVPFTELPTVAAAIVEEMKRQAPVLPAATDERQPGELRDSIVATRGLVEVQSGLAINARTGKTSELFAVTLDREGTPDAVLISAGNDQVPYAAYVEFGTSRTPSEPFFYPTIRLMAQRTQQAIFGAWRKAIDNAVADQ
jgi:HK97 gp10 family phage protein